MIYRISTAAAAIFSYDIVNDLSKQIGKTAVAALRGKKAMTPSLRQTPLFPFIWALLIQIKATLLGLMQLEMHGSPDHAEK